MIFCPQQNNGKYAFISYSSKEQIKADSMRAFLMENHTLCWMAPYDIPAGYKYAHVINEALENCACLVLMLSNSSQNSPFVQKEVERAVTYRKPIIPVQIENLTLSSGFKYLLGDAQIVAVQDIYPESAEIQKVLDGIRSFIKNTTPPSSLIGTPQADSRDDFTQKLENKNESSPNLSPRDNTTGCYELGVQYLYGRDVTRDPEKAVELFKIAASNGVPDAQFLLGLCYQKSIGTHENSTEATSWYQKAAEQGHAKAQLNLGRCFKRGYGIAQNGDEAVKWFEKAANQGLDDAIWELIHYPHDEDLATKWCLQLAERGDAEAQYHLGCMYESASDKAEAAKWFYRAYLQGHKFAATRLSKLDYYGLGSKKRKRKNDKAK